jgi:hypothetical protein
VPELLPAARLHPKGAAVNPWKPKAHPLKAEGRIREGDSRICV